METSNGAESGGTRVKRFAAYAWVVTALTLAVILWGAYVRASRSGDGCGAHWPLCNGSVVPDATHAKTLVEFAHRATSGGNRTRIVSKPKVQLVHFPAASWQGGTRAPRPETDAYG